MATKVLADAIGRGLHSARPSDNDSNALTGTIGRLYYETDTNRLYRDNGTTWDLIILRLGEMGDYFPLTEADDDLLTKVTGGWANIPRNQVSLSDWGTPTGDLAMGTHKITGLVDPTSNQHAATKKYVDDGLAVVVTGIPTNLTQLDPANGDVDLGSHKLTAVQDPTSNQHAATKKYVDDSITTAVAAVVVPDNLSDLDPADLDIDMGNNKLVNVATPTNDQDAANKAYVDDAVAGVTGGSIDYPTNGSVDAREFTLVAGDDAGHYLESHHYGDQDYGYEVIPISSNTTDPWGADLYLAAGTYLVTVLGIARENHGYLQLLMDGTPFGAVSDWYSSAELLNVRLREVLTIADGGLHRLEVLITGAREASADQVWGLTRAWFRKTSLAEGTVYYDDTPLMFDGAAVILGD